MFSIDYNSYRSVAGFGHRVRFLVLHYTAQNFADSVQSLTGKSVSAHYLVPDPEDQTYQAAGFSGVRIFNLVDEDERAWHAGVSKWGSRNNLNDTAIGIEIVNLASGEGEDITFPPFNPQQIAAVTQLAQNILQRYPDITPINVVAHSDIAPGRKSDPGPQFPWRQLHQAGVGAWYDDAVKQHHQREYHCQGIPTQRELLALFAKYGYDTSAATDAEGYRQLVRAFQLHFRPQQYGGVMDVETAAILRALVDKYAA
ncbi:N-acetylmuramyl-L-alanine amidase, negative regulator of AmpC, AmpD [Serratia sp. AS12]|uniref:N-acetylmuramoyl-L-alanine amidase n=1 Tax=Serratia TaxID=613 RepID=UPI00020E996F|nr:MULTISPECIES: N-acetylmuramoyl-L-alanine amidase [Serratia]AEF46457.1 N-acetylmuramyl-L-alanine amidase, negative regulator of AmpC, AmpD [Serratia plymuthica AS9]AEF51409.1 N-acetylmuramyl-L-alanine amidase, negative regulator of AmpC, AmpD [Serratia sp. AS12]AEG29117.1 N-acetylmuramyl-L-alanine amidase, negative regulator of AmpC, AmpD [Serratia sp. AS13]UTN95171.1 N-acetylmuramoyl-L-alanine amidase [Serratia plymuthica]